MFLKECKQIIKSITYIAFAVILIVFCFSQIESEFKRIEKPTKGLENYGIKYDINSKALIPNACSFLALEYRANKYTAYPIGFYKQVKLNKNKQSEIAGILKEMTGLSSAELITLVNNYITSASQSSSTSTGPFSPDVISLPLSQSLTRDKFFKLMKKADDIIGGGSKYSSTYLAQFGRTQKTYEEALTEYNNIIETDKVTGAYARLFCDYLGIMLAILPVFVATAFCMKDRRAKMQELIYIRQLPSLKITFIRYLALITMMFLPVLLLAVYWTIVVLRKYSGFTLDILAFIKYSFSWLLPTLMVSTSVGMFLTELTDTPIAILIQGLWWFIGLFAGMKYIDGGYGTCLALRHNVLGNTRIYIDNFSTLVINRVVYIIFAITLIALTVMIYEFKRRGKLNVWGNFKKVFTYFADKPKA